ncbi:MAG: hypothetical protein LIP23_02755, partial [Planctomycetes bacterium]|nr:hypothetical protein [Planctomycetota bacterium]
MNASKWRNRIGWLVASPIFFGAVVGVAAVAVQIAVMPGRDAYGICTICHTRDLMAWLAHLVGIHDGEGTIAHLAWHTFTTVGLAGGAFIAAWRHGELRLVRARQQWKMAALGLLTAISGLVGMSCPTRLFLRLAYADTFA